MAFPQENIVLYIIHNEMAFPQENIVLYIIHNEMAFPQENIILLYHSVYWFSLLFQKDPFIKKKHILPRCNIFFFFSIKSWHCVFLWLWCCSSSDNLAHMQNNFESVPQACLGNENDRKVSRRMHYFKNTYLHIHSRLLPDYSRPKSRRHNLPVYTRHRDTWIHYHRTQL